MRADPDRIEKDFDREVLAEMKRTREYASKIIATTRDARLETMARESGFSDSSELGAVVKVGDRFLR